MKYKFILLTSLMIFSTLAHSRVFTVKESKNRTEYACPISHGGCDLSKVEEKALDKCYNAGFNYCYIIESDIRSGRAKNSMCGIKRKWTCIARVRGSK